jgi:uncharacterized membrane protein YfcA
MSPADLFDTPFLIAAAAALAGGVIHGFAGFGSGFVIVPVMAFVYGPVDAVTVNSLASLPAIAPLVPGMLRRLDRAEVLPVLAPLVVAVPAGAFALTVVDPLVMRRTIGAFVVFSALVLLRGYRWSGPRNRLVGVGAGVLGGVIGGSTSTGGAVVTAYLLAAEGPADVKRAGILAITTTISIITVVTLAAIGAVGPRTLLLAAALTVPLLVGIWFGAWAFGRASDAAYRRFALVLLMVVGVATVVF